MTTNGGGYTLILHTYYTNAAPPPTAAFKQSLALWASTGVGDAKTYAGLTDQNPYVMGLAAMAVVVDAPLTTTMRFQGDTSLYDMPSPSMSTSTYAITSNTAESTAVTTLCGTSSAATTNCFLGLVFVGAGSSGVNACVGAARTGGSGFWYSPATLMGGMAAGCYSYDPFLTNDPVAFAGALDPGTTHWSWFVR
jgi:hypothetical protein